MQDFYEWLNSTFNEEVLSDNDPRFQFLTMLQSVMRYLDRGIIPKANQMLQNPRMAEQMVPHIRRDWERVEGLLNNGMINQPGILPDNVNWTPQNSPAIGSVRGSIGELSANPEALQTLVQAAQDMKEEITQLHQLVYQQVHQ